MDNKWGGINCPSDNEHLKTVLSRYNGVQHVRMCELGIDEGYTGNRLVEFLKESNVQKVEYHGIDNLSYKNLTNLEQKVSFQFPEMKFLEGDRSELNRLSNLDFVFVDACHCAECVCLDSIAVSKKIKVGGLMSFHDTSLKVQYPYCQRRDAWQHYENGTPIRPLNVVEGIGMGRSKWNGDWELILQTGDDLEWGGVRTYLRIK